MRNGQVELRDLRVDTGPPIHLYGWIAAALTFGVGDLVTTFVGIAHFGTVEGNALPAAVLDAVGLSALLVVKVVAFAAFYALFRYAPPLYRASVPIGLTLLGTAVVGWNLVALLVVSGVL